jgi:thiosulfate dehydrogenase (quinone) large subunit
MATITQTRNRVAAEVPVTGARTPVPEPIRTPTQTAAVRYVAAGLRLALGFVFLWAFLDKVFGFGFATPEKGAWINGGSPTKGFLANGAAGPFADFYHSIAGATWANWAFMLGLAGIGVALITGIGLRIAAVAGSVLLVMMWSVVLPPENNPFMDDHLIYAGTLVLLALLNAGATLGLGRLWARTPLVRNAPWLK